MDNAYILLLIIKKHINIGAFVYWYNNSIVTYESYLIDGQLISDSCLSEFEFKYLISFLRLVGEIS